MTTLLVGARDPEALRVVLTPGNSGLDMRNVTSCTLHVTRPDGSTTTWSTVLSGATVNQVEALHVFDSLGVEVGTPGNYVIEPRVLAPGSRRCALFKLSVTPYPTP
jgi:hypothetical protein